MWIFGDSFANKWRSRRNNAAIENALIELSEEISSIKASIARLNAKTAVEARKNRSGSLDKELKKLELEFGGKVVDVEEPTKVE